MDSDENVDLDPNQSSGIKTNFTESKKSVLNEIDQYAKDLINDELKEFY
jgi:hypothetical protein